MRNVSTGMYRKIIFTELPVNNMRIQIPPS